MGARIRKYPIQTGYGCSTGNSWLCGPLRNLVARLGVRLVVSAVVWGFLYTSSVNGCREAEGFR